MSPNMPRFVAACFFYLGRRSLTRRYDLVHVHNMPDVLVFSAIVPKLLGAKIILDLHDPMPELMQTIFQLPEDSLSVGILKRLEKWSIRFADLVLTVNLACKKIYSSRSCQPDKIKVVINSPDDEIFRFAVRYARRPAWKERQRIQSFCDSLPRFISPSEWFRPGDGVTGKSEENNFIRPAESLRQTNRLFRGGNGIGPPTGT